VVGTDDTAAADPYGRTVDHDEALERLPAPYAVALRLHDWGASDEVIAIGLGIDLTAVSGVLDVARRKLLELAGPRDGRHGT
jgi:DNA-directed RNA polymerase specialized sigma24 family protein